MKLLGVSSAAAVLTFRTSSLRTVSSISIGREIEDVEDASAAVRFAVKTTLVVAVGLNVMSYVSEQPGDSHGRVGDAMLRDPNCCVALAHSKVISSCGPSISLTLTEKVELTPKIVDPVARYGQLRGHKLNFAQEQVKDKLESTSHGASF